MMGCPNDWKIVTVGKVADFLTGFPFSSQRFADSGIRLVRGSNVKRAALDWAFDISKYWPDDDPGLRPYHVRDGDIVIAMDGALVGRSYARIRQADLPAYLVQRVARLRGSSVDQALLYQWIGSEQFVQHVDAVKTHTAIPHISPQDIRGFRISIPTDVREQGRIGDALTEADDLVASLERLITKKQAIKQGMMQELLTGRTRLPGFAGSWSKTTLGSLGTFLKGRGIKRDDVRSMGTGCIRYGELYTTFSDYTDKTRSFVSARVAATALPLRTGDLLFAGSGETRDEIGKCVAYIGAVPVVAGGDVIVLRGDQFNPVYLALLANTPEVVTQKARAGQGDAVVHIYSQALAAVEVDMPSRAEQDAVARLILDVDQELALLRERLAKARNVKQGMMQELLTGRTRLPLQEAVA